jgi:SAM-dependent methyltransferase
VVQQKLVGAQAGADEVKAQYRDSSKLTRRANIHKYGRSPIGWFDWIAREARLPAEGAVLDIGCGPGWMWAVPGFPAGLFVTLADLSPGMVAEAVGRVRGLGRYRAVDGREADAAALPFAEATFDAVLACHMLYHVPDPGRALDEMVRVLKPGGLLVVTTNGADNMTEMYALAGAAFGGEARDPGGATFGIEAAEAALRARLVDVTVSTYRDELWITDGEDIVGTLTSYPPGDGASEAQFAALREMIAARTVDGVFRTAKRQGLVRGVKAG